MLVMIIHITKVQLSMIWQDIGAMVLDPPLRLVTG